MESVALTLTLAATFFWAAAQVVGKIPILDLGPLLFCAVRFSALAPIFVSIAFLDEMTLGLKLNGPLVAASLSGLIGAVGGTYLFFRLLEKSQAHRIIPVANTCPFWIILLAVLFLGERPTFVIPFSAFLISLGSVLLAPRRKISKSVNFEIPLAFLVAFGGQLLIYSTNIVFLKVWPLL